MLRKCFYWCIVAIGLAFLSVSIHEIGHQLVAKMYGIGGYIQFHVGNGFFFPEQQVPWLVSAGGGLITALFMIVFFWLVPRLTSSLADAYLELSAYIVASVHASYAWIEVMRAGEKWWIYPFVSTIIICLLGLFLYKNKIVKWLESNGHSNGIVAGG